MNQISSWLERGILWILIPFEAMLFCAFYTREIAPYPPVQYDQAVYLSQTYMLQEQVSKDGLGAFLREIGSSGHAGTLALPIEGALFGLIIGGARFPQLCVLFVAFCALQVFAFSTARILFRDRAYGLLALGLILCESSFRFHAGGLFDFRIDFLAYSLYGIWVCAVLRSNCFVDRWWSIATGLIGALLALNRFLASIYIVGICAGFAALTVLIWLRNRTDVDLVRRLRQRLLNLGLTLGLFAAIVGPILFINRSAIYGKYGYLQFVYEKDIRARQFGIFSLADHLLFYPRSILMDHLGQSFLWVCAISLTGALTARFFLKATRIVPRPQEGDGEAFWYEILFLFATICGPILLLTIDISKSPVIGGIVGVPTALLVVAIVAWIAKADYGGDTRTRSYQVLLGSSFLVVLVGVFNLFSGLSGHAVETVQHRELERVADLDRWLVNYALDHNWRRPAISFDVIHHWFCSYAIVASGFEQTREFVDFRPGLANGSDIMGVDRSEALSLLANSDFIMLTTLPKEGIYPFFQKVSAYWPDLKEWADKNRILACRVPFDEGTVMVYVRPSAQVSQVSGGWITSKGIWISAARADLEKFPQIRLGGRAHPFLPKIPTVSASVETETGPIVLPASFRLVGKRYEIHIDATAIKDIPSDPVRVSLKSDTFFVPKKLGINADTRELVVLAPDRVELLPRQ
jgi:hypothetical protein